MINNNKILKAIASKHPVTGYIFHIITKYIRVVYKSDVNVNEYNDVIQ
jgi:hypothetical protein